MSNNRWVLNNAKAKKEFCRGFKIFLVVSYVWLESVNVINTPNGLMVHTFMTAGSQ